MTVHECIFSNLGGVMWPDIFQYAWEGLGFTEIGLGTDENG